MFAADDGLSQTFSTCMDQAGGVTPSMVECMNAETERQDVRLNKAYKDIMANLSAGRKKQLQEAQRLWIKYRKANCDFYYDPDGGSIARLNANDCFLSATAARAKELEGFKQ
ncbi:MAG: lysozyme inhibitor LprI family protein [Methylobacter sp.]